MNIDKIRNCKIFFPFLYSSSIVYRIITDIRNYFYDSGVFKKYKANIPVISVGNLTTGGTGKTPFILYLLGKLKDRCKIVVVSRGYGRISKGLQIVSDGKGKIVHPSIGGDEPVLIANKFPEIPIIVSEKRSEGIKLAREKFNANLILLDDAFQHRQVVRDCDIVLVNANRPLNKESILPLGNLRENKNNLNRAHIILITKVVEETNINDQIEFYKKYDAGLFVSKFNRFEVKAVDDNKSQEKEKLIQQPFLAFCGIASPESFKRSLSENGVSVKKAIIFNDHKNYLDKDIQLIISTANKNNCTNIITTEKDFVKLKREEFEGYNLHVLEMKIEVENEDDFLKKVKNIIDLT